MKYDRGREQAKPKDATKVLKRLWIYLAKYKGLLSLAIILTILSNLLALVGPMLSGYAIDAISPGKGKVNFSLVFYYAIWMVVCYVISAALSYGLSVLMIHISKKLVGTMRTDVFNKLMVLPVGYFDKYQAGDIISLISYDIDTINTSLSTDLVQICASVITVIISFIMMVMISPVLVLVMLITIPLSIVYTKYMTGKIRPLARLRSKRLGELNGYVEEMISGHKTIQAYVNEEPTKQTLAKKNAEAVDAYYNTEYYGSIVGPTVNFINNLSLSLITMFGAILYLFEKISLGNISSFLLYSRKFSGPINEAANIISELQSACAAAERIFVLLDEAPEQPDAASAIDLKEVKGEVVFSNVQFGYDPNRIIINDLNFCARPGSLTAIGGPPGAGKTTIMNLLMRFYDTNEGVIYLDGNDIRTIKRSQLRQTFAMVLQDTWLFEGTIYENIAYGRKSATRDEVEAAAKAANIHNYIKRLPKGYDTVLTDEGLNISKGQKQLLTIARAMLMDAKMLILDEATSNVDTRTEIKIKEAMVRLMEHKTCFVIAHRLSTIQNADDILVVENGNIVEQGNHQELIHRKGIYYRLYHSQYE